MRKFWIVLFLMLACSMLTASAPKAETVPGDILRLHVIANSDSPGDQRVKLAVRDAILEKLPPSGSAADAEAYLLEHGGALLATVENTLEEQGFSYRAQLMLGNYAFPDRTYGEVLYPAGDYRALRVILGGGAGQNWWCVLFPPLCIVTEESEPMPDGEELVFESSIANWFRSRKENS